jgi:SlyX protein
MSNQKNLNEQASFSAPIEDLQVRIAFLDELVDQLNMQIALQGREINDLKKQMQILYQRVDATQSEDGIAPFDPLLDKPPHY